MTHSLLMTHSYYSTSKHTHQQYGGLNRPQSRICVTLADGKTHAMASGTYPANAGKTGVIPNARIRSSILCWSDIW